MHGCACRSQCLQFISFSSVYVKHVWLWPAKVTNSDLFLELLVADIWQHRAISKFDTTIPSYPAKTGLTCHPAKMSLFLVWLEAQRAICRLLPREKRELSLYMHSKRKQEFITFPETSTSTITKSWVLSFVSTHSWKEHTGLGIFLHRVWKQRLKVCKGVSGYTNGCDEKYT